MRGLIGCKANNSHGVYRTSYEVQARGADRNGRGAGAHGGRAEGETTKRSLWARYCKANLDICQLSTRIFNSTKLAYLLNHLTSAISAAALSHHHVFYSISSPVVTTAETVANAGFAGLMAAG